MPDEEEDDQEDSAAERASWSRERTIAETLAAKLTLQWQGPISTLSRAGKAFEGLEALLGGAQGGGFDLGVGPSQACVCVSIYLAKKLQTSCKAYATTLAPNNTSLCNAFVLSACWHGNKMIEINPEILWMYIKSVAPVDDRRN